MLSIHSGVFQHLSPCVDYILVHQAGQQDPLSIRCASPSLPCPALALHALGGPLCACMADHPLPRPLQVVIFTVSSTTRTSKYLLAQNSTLFRMVLSLFAEIVVMKNVGACSVACVCCGCPGGGPKAVFGLLCALLRLFFSLFCFVIRIFRSFLYLVCVFRVLIVFVFCNSFCFVSCEPRSCMCITCMPSRLCVCTQSRLYF